MTYNKGRDVIQNMSKIKINDISTEKFDCFNVHTRGDDYSFCHIEIEDNIIFYEKLFEYFFSEDKLIRYCEHTSGVKFTPNRKNFITLYRALEIYIDDFNLAKNMKEIEELLDDVLDGKLKLEEGKKESFARLDKIGKIGEYIFSCLLYDFFSFDCIIPKVNLTTNYNMNVYGIDTLFYSEENDLALFGESKCSISLEKGIQLIKKSLADYEKQIENEFKLILRNRMLGKLLNGFGDTYGEIMDESIDFLEFKDFANLKSIGVPMFIAHGTDTESLKILEKLSKLRGTKLFGLETKYYAISLPIIDKSKLISVFIKKIREKGEFYEAEISKRHPSFKR